MRATRAAVTAAALAVILASCGSSDEASTDSADDTGDASSTEASDVAAGATAGECAPVDGSDTVIREFDAEPPFCLDPDAEYSALITTSTGEVTIDLDQAAAPRAVNSFVFLARNNYFDDTVCHRVVQDFVVQCGDPTASGAGGPGYRFDDELPLAGEYEYGSIAMANAGPDTNGSQFFIISGDAGVALPPLYSRFGQVPTDDFGVIESMNALGPTDGTQSPTEEIRILDVEIIQS